MTNKSLKIFGGETTREEMVLGAKRPGLKIEAKRLGGKRLGGNVLGAKRLVTIFKDGLEFESLSTPLCLYGIELTLQCSW